VTDAFKRHMNSPPGPTANFLLGRQMERELLVKAQTAQWKKSAEKIRTPNLAGYKICTAYCAILDFIHQQAWRGACHASSAVFYVLLREQGVDGVLCRGTVENNGILFNHSWVEVEARVYDAAVSNTLSREFDSPPVFGGIDLATAQATDLVHGVQSGQEPDEITVFVRDKGFNAYMDAFPHHNHGLWGVAKDVGKRIGIRLNVGKIRARYSDAGWIERASHERGGAEAVFPTRDQFTSGASLRSR
jgi:hypothetical protein